MCVTSQAEQFCLLSETLPLLTLHFMGLSDPFSNVFSFCAEASALFSFVLSLGSNFCMQAVSLVGMLGTGNFQAILPNLQRRNDFSAVPKVFVCVLYSRLARPGKISIDFQCQIVCGKIYYGRMHYPQEMNGEKEKKVCVCIQFLRVV